MTTSTTPTRQAALALLVDTARLLHREGWLAERPSSGGKHRTGWTLTGALMHLARRADTDPAGAIAALVHAIDTLHNVGGYALLDPADQIVWLTDTDSAAVRRLSLAILDAYNRTAGGLSIVDKALDAARLLAAGADTPAAEGPDGEPASKLASKLAGSDIVDTGAPAPRAWAAA